MSTSYNFKDNLTLDNNKYLKWLDKTGTSRANIISLDNDNNVNVNSAFGNMNVNINNQDSYTFLNSNNSKGNVLVGTRLGIGFNTTSNMTSSLTLVKNGSIGLNTTIGTNDGYLGISSWSNLDNNGGSRVMLYGNDHVTYPGGIHLYSGNVTNGNVNVYTGNDSLKMQILRDGTFSFIPDGVTTRLTINDTMSTFTHDIVVSSTTESNNASTGALQIRGGIGISGNLYIDGTISLNNATGNINFDSSQASNSYTTGAIFLSGGIGISTTVNSSSVTSGGALSIAGGAAFGKDVYIGGKLTVINTTPSTSSQNASFVVYGGMGINDSILSRSDASQFQIAPKTSGAATEITFYSLNNFTSSTNTSSSWIIGQNTGSVGPGKFCLRNSNFGNVLTASYDGGIEISGKVIISNTTNAIDENDGGALTVSGGASFKKDVYIGGSITLASGGTISGGGGSSEFTYLTLTATDNAINLSTGSLVTFGGIVIGGEDDAQSITQGGSILTAGGVSIGKSLFVGGPIMQIPIGDTASRPNPAKTGYIRYNSTINDFEGYGNTWGSLGGGGGGGDDLVVINVTTATLNASIGVTSASAKITNANITTLTAATLLNTNVITTNVSTATLNVTGLTAGNINFTGSLYQNGSVYTSSQWTLATSGNLTYMDGNVGIGTTSPEYLLDVGGNLRATTISVLSSDNATGIGTGGSLTVLGGASFSKDLYVGGTVTSSSDIRLKKNIEDFNTSTVLDKIDNIRSIKYNYKNDESNTPYVGFIAQDFIEDFPELLRCPRGGYYSLDYQKVSVILMECIKELKTELRRLSYELKEIKPVRKRILKGKHIIYQEDDK
jgi:hypothetical protein